ncbi:helix-turn-helix transcriptional regulator [Qipengyuania sp. SS22]|uniref:helix-turn-helix transcriptional regulator n=1 Tax=Qipengyuania sp. SS22 TaxID=2979461 RepID=UPI0021E58C51|nr:helix-turn-helix transcriptional regulator [Qipengyuania sp. SS22]UYH54767.1 helix-turn-helix transcriptional regulator [Qipengyuania sp. SS22]
MGGLRNFFEDFLASLDHAESADAIWTAALDAISQVPTSGEVHVFYRDAVPHNGGASAEPSAWLTDGSRPADTISSGHPSRAGTDAPAAGERPFLERSSERHASMAQAMAIAIDDPSTADRSGLPAGRGDMDLERGHVPDDLGNRASPALDDCHWIYLAAVMHCTHAYLAMVAEPPPYLGHPELSSRQSDVLAGLAAGKRQKEIAYDLGISENTVAYHVAQLRERLSCSHSNEIVAAAYLTGLLKSPAARRS